MAHEKPGKESLKTYSMLNVARMNGVENAEFLKTGSKGKALYS